MKKNIKLCLNWLISQLMRCFDCGTLGRYIHAQILYQSMHRVREAKYRDLSLKFAVPNELNKYRADSFATKEPETLEWIDEMPVGSVLWDIGANVGLYSCFAAARKNCRTFAFEPSVFNLELLARNIFLNGLTDRITIVPLPLSEKLGVNTLNMTSTDWGGALSTFGQSYGHDGKSMEKVFDFPTVGLSMVDAVELLKIPQPDYIKMDVDGIEHLILKGGAPVLKKIRGILIEINDKFDDQARESDRFLREAGLTLKEKRHAEVFNTGMAQYTFNQIWIREGVAG